MVTPATSLLPDDEGLELIHTRTYETKVYQSGENEVIVRGVVSDMKPAGLYLEGDPEPLEIHQMHVEMKVELPSLTITEAGVRMQTHPHESCPGIIAHYDKLVGLSIARGFTRKVRELFGGPRGCTHTTALLTAMAPAVVQSTWSVMVKQMRAQAEARDAAAGDGEAGEAGNGDNPFAEVTPESATAERRAKFESNLNTCHVWDEDGPHVEDLRAGKAPEAPLQIRQRMEKLGLDAKEWRPSGS